jgi:hypothetical protein
MYVSSKKLSQPYIECVSDNIALLPKKYIGLHSFKMK